MRRTMRNPAPLHMKRFVPRVVTEVTTSGMPSPGMESEKQAGATGTLPQESRLASECPSNPARRSRCKSASLCPSKPAARYQGNPASLCRRRAADLCQCRSQQRWPRRSALALEVEALTDPEAMEDTGAEKQFSALCCF